MLRVLQPPRVLCFVPLVAIADSCSTAVCCSSVVTFSACAIWDSACIGTTFSDEQTYCCPLSTSAVQHVSIGSGYTNKCVAPASAARCSMTSMQPSFTGTLYKMCEGGTSAGVACEPDFSVPAQLFTSRRKCCATSPPIWVGIGFYPLAGCSAPQTCASANSAVAAVVVDGGWTSWSVCSASCGGGTQTRSCSAPQRTQYGRPCNGSSWYDPVDSTVQQRECNTQSCVTPAGPSAAKPNENTFSQGGAFRGWTGGSCTGSEAFSTAFSAGDCINIPTGGSIQVSTV